MRPILFLDVDGVINTMGSKLVETEWSGKVDGYTGTVPVGTAVRIEKLLEHFKPVWLTTWCDKAHRCWAEHIGVPAEPEWQYVPWVRNNYRTLGDSKLLGMEEWLEENGGIDRPWVWVDDDGHWEVQEMVRMAGNEYEVPGAGLIITPRPHVGLTDEHVELALKHLEGAR